MLAAAAVLGLLVGAYVGMATIGVRQLEAYWLAAVELGEQLDDYSASRRRGQRVGEVRITRDTGADRAVAEATLAHHGRLAELRRKAADVVALDPGVRRLRQRLLAGLDLEADLDLARDFEGQRSRWRLGRGDPPPPPPLALRTGNEPFTTVPTGNRLVVELEEDLVELDIDAGTGRVIDGSSVYSMAAAGRFVAFVDDDDAKVVEVGSTARPRPIGPADYIMGTGDGRTVWLVTGVEDDEDEEGPRMLTRVDVVSGATVATFTVTGDVAAASGRHVAVTHYSRRTSTIEVWDVEKRAVVRRIPEAVILDLAGDVLVWHDTTTVHLTSLADGRDRAVPVPEPSTFPADARVAPDGAAVVVLWGDNGRRSSGAGRLAILATGDLAETATVALGGEDDPASATWSPDGKRVYLVLQRLEDEGLPLLGVFHVPERRYEVLPLEGDVYDMAAF